jgi:hypothetical protein
LRLLHTIIVAFSRGRGAPSAPLEEQAFTSTLVATANTMNHYTIIVVTGIPDVTLATITHICLF